MKRNPPSGIRSLCLAGSVVLLLAAPLPSQTPTGGLTGTVRDQSGAVIPGVTVTLTKTDTALTRSTITSDDGKYLFALLPPGEYEARVVQSGFSEQVKRVVVNVGLTGTLDFSLSVGAGAQQVVAVTAETPIIDTVDNAVKAQVTADVIKDMPLNGRNFLDLAGVAPGAEVVNGDSFDPTKAGYSGVSIAGQRGRSTRISVDGGEINDEVVGTTVQNFSPEIIQEFQVGTSTFDLSTGASSQGAVNVVTRSGENDLHGAGYVYFRHSQISAFPGLGGKEGNFKPPFDREHGGFWLGGPLKKDRVFWFVNYEQNNQDQQAFITTLLPAGNPFDGATPQPFDERTSTVKLDFKANDRNNLFARWSRDDNSQIAFFPVGAGFGKAPSGCSLCTENSGNQTNLANQAVVGLTSNIGSTMVNDLRLNYSTLGNRISPRGSGPEVRIRNTNFKIGTNRIFPQSTFQNRWQLREDFSWQKGKHNIKTGGTWHNTHIFGSFQFWSPADIQLHQPRDVMRSFPTTDADLLSWPVRFVRTGVGDATLPVNTRGDRTINDRYAFYIEDSYKLRPNFTLNLGLNYRFDTNLVNFDMPKPAILSTVLQGNLNPTQRDKNNLGGRFGFAWDLGGNGNTVVRAGWGLYYDTVIDNARLFERSDLGPAGSGYVSFDQFQIMFPSFPGDGDNFFDPGDGYTLANALRDLPAVRASLVAPPDPSRTNLEVHESTSSLMHPGLVTPYSNQFNIGLQHRLPGNLVFTADFLYRQTVHEYLLVDLNHSEAAIGPLDPHLGLVDATTSDATSKYLAGNFRIERRFAKGFGFTGTYVRSRFKAMNDDTLGLGGTTDPTYNHFNIGHQYGPSALDRTHRFTFTGIWDVPGYSGGNWFGRVWAQGWRLTGISTVTSGPPLTVFVDGVSLTGSSPSQPNLIDGAPFGAIGRTVGTVEELNQLIGNWNNTRAGIIDAYGNDIPRLATLPDDGSVRFGDSKISQDIRVSKSFRIRENVAIEWIGEVFNLFNVANLRGYDTQRILPATNDCAAAACTASEISTLGFLQPTERATSVFGFGGPRAFQFALRVVF